MKNIIHKTLLFIPPANCHTDKIDVNPLPPLGLAYIGAVLEKQGVEVKIFDCLLEGYENHTTLENGIIRIGTPFEEIRQIITDFKPDLVGVNNLFTIQRDNAHYIYKLAKEIDPEIVTVAGGAHPTIMPELVLSDRNVDFVVMGEGEDSIIDLINFIEGRSNASILNGVGYKKDNNHVIIPKSRFIHDLDSIPFPARHLLNMQGYFGLKSSHGTRKKKKFSPIITSRGCPAGCTFCSAHKVWGKLFRFRSPENVILEMKEIKERYGIEEIMFEDDNVTLNPARAQKLFDLMIVEKLNLIWDTPNGVAAWTLNENLISKMKQSGCYHINFALETGNQHVMDKIIKKPLQLAKAKPLVHYAKSIGLDVGIFLVIGMPGETEEQIWDSFKMANELEIYLPFLSIATPYPGTELYDICRKEDYFRDNFSLDDLFIRSYPLNTPNWDSEKLQQIYNNGLRYLFLSFLRKHPLEFLKVLLNKFRSDPFNFLKTIFKFVISKNNWRVIK